jgi:hypothetical protein
MRTNLDEIFGALSRVFASWTAGHTAAANSGGDSGMGGFASARGGATAKSNLPSDSDDKPGDT